MEVCNIEDGDGGVGGGKDEGPLPLGHPLLPGDAIVMIVLFGEGVARNEPGNDAGEMTFRVITAAPPCALIAIASTLDGLVGKSLIVF